MLKKLRDAAGKAQKAKDAKVYKLIKHYLDDTAKMSAEAKQFQASYDKTIAMLGKAQADLMMDYGSMTMDQYLKKEAKLNARCKQVDAAVVDFRKKMIGYQKNSSKNAKRAKQLKKLLSAKGQTKYGL